MEKNEDIEIYKRAAELVSYDPETGSMKWLPREENTPQDKRWNSRCANKECGNIYVGYRRIGFKCILDRRVSIAAHRLAWFIIHGKLPEGEIDHINHDRLDNRIANLRDVSSCINMRNRPMPKNNTSGVCGVRWYNSTQKWRAEVSLNGKSNHLGYFDNIEDAERAVKEFRAANGFTEQHGRPKDEQK